METVRLLFFLAITVCQCVGLLKNCVSEADWNRDTSGAPRCEVVIPEMVKVGCFGSKDDTEISVNRLSPDLQNRNNTPTIVCNASYPIDVDEQGFKVIKNITLNFSIDLNFLGLKFYYSIFQLKGQPNIFFFRRLNPNSTEEEPEKIHSIVVPLFTNIWSPRWFIFRSIENPKLYTKFYFYYPGSYEVICRARVDCVILCGFYSGPNDRSLPFDWPNEKIFPTVVEPEGRFATLPCQVTHRSDFITLRKNRCSVCNFFLSKWIFNAVMNFRLVKI